MTSPYDLPPHLPVPIDDGAAAHLVGQHLPELSLPITSGGSFQLPAECPSPAVFFFYPRTGVPGEPPNLGFLGEDWDDIPGARGCTPQNCAFRDAALDFAALGVTVFGVSTQTRDFQRAFRERNHVPFHYLSDEGLALTRALRLPTFEFPVESGGPNTLIKRMAWWVVNGTIAKIWYPVFPPQKNARDVLTWIRQSLG